jgi:hypothetical protein
MLHTIKKGEQHFSTRAGGLRFHGGTTFAEWRGRFNDTTWYGADGLQPAYNQGSGWSFGKPQKNAISWAWRPVMKDGRKLQELCLCTVENGVRTWSRQTICLPLNEDFFVQLKTNGTFASLAARTFTGDWDMITGKWGARTKKGFWLGFTWHAPLPIPEDMAFTLKRLVPVA